MFVYIKRAFQRSYIECKHNSLLPFVLQTFRRFAKFDMKKVFEHCGWKINGTFDALEPMASQFGRLNSDGNANEDELEFRLRTNAN